MNNPLPSGKAESYEVIITEDEETGDLILPIPDPVLQELGWKPGDDIEFGLNDKGEYVLKKVEK